MKGKIRKNFRDTKNNPGDIFGKLTLIERDHLLRTRTNWIVSCECGTIKSVRQDTLHKNSSCGCIGKLTYKDGDIINNWTLLESSKNFRKCKCRCICGKIKNVDVYSLSSGKSKSCGCVPKTKHNMSFSREYKTWCSMMRRCYDINHPHYKSYGGRGIKVFEPWHDFRNFYAEMGKKPEGLSIERMNNDGNYEPSNCVWANASQQANNRRSTLKLKFNNTTKSLRDWCTEYNIDKLTVYKRLRKGWSISDALITPII